MVIRRMTYVNFSKGIDFSCPCGWVIYITSLRNDTCDYVKGGRQMQEP